MRDRFSDLIKKGVAAFEEKPVGSPIPTLDPMVKLYNNIWGALTDTHMSAVEDGYIITGTFVETPYWDRFKYSGFWGTTNIKLGSGYTSLDNMIYVNGYQMTPDIYNGDYVIKLTKRPEPAAAPEGAECDACVSCCPSCYPAVVSMGESQIPHPFKEFFTEGEQKAIVEGWKKGERNAAKVVENLNSAVKEHSFRLSSDNQYVVVDEHLQISLN